MTRRSTVTLCAALLALVYLCENRLLAFIQSAPATAPDVVYIPTPQPVIARMMFAGFGAAVAACGVHFVSQAGDQAGALNGLARRRVAVRNCRGIGKRDMVSNDALPKLEVDPETYEVKGDGVRLTSEPADVLPLAQRYFLF